jgi:hypothetical protein
MFNIGMLKPRMQSLVFNTPRKEVPILDYPKKVETSSFNRKLECVALLVTSKEVISGRFKSCIENISKTTNSCGVDLVIIVNNNQQINEINSIVTILNGKFNNIKIHNLNLSPSEDLYIPFPDKKTNLPPRPKYGYSSGPNNMFLKTMDFCKKYNTTLLLETDCSVDPDWLILLSKYVENAGGFWISGSLFYGSGFTPYWLNPTLVHSLNGVALYATGNTDFQKFISVFDNWLSNKVDVVNYMAYDHGLYAMIYEYIQKAEEYWLYAFRNYVSNPFIINLSPDYITNINKNELKKKYNYAVLHMK